MLRHFTNAISRALGFSKTESRGTLVLIFIIFIVMVSTHFRVSYLKNQPKVAADSSALEWIQKVQASYDLKKKEELDTRASLPKSEFQKEKRTKFKQASVASPVEKKKEIIIGDLNSATTSDLQTVHGIGPSFSARITKYRSLLGGFADSAQLTEVYGLSPETIDELLKHFKIASPVIPININSDSIKLLARHPYISYDLAHIIINFRREHGDIQSAEDLKKIKAIDEHTFLRIKPYLE
ncbi:MAG: helix-hairpin-helix domain-containing protein [Ekhidna sp.]